MAQQSSHPDQTNGSKNGMHLPHLPRYHSHPTPQYAAGANSGTQTPKSGQNSGRNSGRSTPKLNYHVHHTAQYFAGGPHHDVHLTAEQNAANLAKYQSEHAAQLAQNRALHGGHADGDEYAPSRAAHHHPNLPHYQMHSAPQFFAAAHAYDDGRKPKSGTSTPKEGSGVHLPHYHLHEAPKYYAASHAMDDKPNAAT